MDDIQNALFTSQKLIETLQMRFLINPTRGNALQTSCPHFNKSVE
jgi:hypothetical protein